MIKNLNNNGKSSQTNVSSITSKYKSNENILHITGKKIENYF